MDQAKRDMVDLYEAIQNAADRLHLIATREADNPGSLEDYNSAFGMKQFAENVQTECETHESYFEAVEETIPDNWYDPIDEMIQRIAV